MAQYLYVVFSEPKPGREAEYNRWYNEQHLRDVLSVPGFHAAQRFECEDSSGLPGKYLAVYQVEANNPQEALHELRLAKLPLSDATNPSKTAAVMFKAITKCRKAAAT